MKPTRSGPLMPAFPRRKGAETAIPATEDKAGFIG